MLHLAQGAKSQKGLGRRGFLEQTQRKCDCRFEANLLEMLEILSIEAVKNQVLPVNLLSLSLDILGVAISWLIQVASQYVLRIMELMPQRWESLAQFAAAQSPWGRSL